MDDSLYQSTRRAWQDIWDEAAIEQERASVMNPRAQAYFDIFTCYLPRDAVILEAGCGLGAAVMHLRMRGFDVIGLDYVDAALRRARADDPTLWLQAGDVHALPYAAGSLAGYLSFGVLEHFAHGPLPALREANRVLRMGGVLVLTVPYPNVVQRLVRLRRRLRGQVERTDEDFYETTYTRRQLEASARQAGFRVALSCPTSHSFTLWGLGGPFRAPGYYQTSVLAEALGRVLGVVIPWAFNFSTLLIAHKAVDWQP
ncbi:MAG: class I SAM-dependent methyltransferase [Anaerolineae bacterium]|nr:class I SAM-dependent methyltransferase [Anaerolineae bacterium]